MEYLGRRIARQNVFEEAYIDEVIRQVEEKMAREQYDEEEKFGGRLPRLTYSTPRIL